MVPHVSTPNARQSYQRVAKHSFNALISYLERSRASFHAERTPLTTSPVRTGKRDLFYRYLPVEPNAFYGGYRS